MKVLFFHHAGGKGGAPNSLLFLIQQLKTLGIECIVACRARGGATEFYESHGFRTCHHELRIFPHVSAVPSPPTSPQGLKNLLAWAVSYRKGVRGMVELIRAEQPDVVHLNSLTLLPYAPHVRKAGAKCVVHVREPVNRGMLGVRRAWLRRLAGNHCDAVIYICRDNMDRLAGSSENGHLIYNPIPFDKFQRNIDGVSLRKELDIQPNQPVIFHPGGLSRIKGIQPLIKAMEMLVLHQPTVRCLLPDPLVGAGKGATAANKTYRQLQRSAAFHNYVLLPFTEHVEQLYAIADIVSAPFVIPHFARAVLEAGAMGKPVVASDIGGIREVVERANGGILVPPKNANALAQGFLRLIEDKSLAENLGRAGYEWVHQEYDAVSYGQKVLDVYKSILG